MPNRVLTMVLDDLRVVEFSTRSDGGIWLNVNGIRLIVKNCESIQLTKGETTSNEPNASPVPEPGVLAGGDQGSGGNPQATSIGTRPKHSGRTRTSLHDRGRPAEGP